MGAIMGIWDKQNASRVAKPRQIKRHGRTYTLKPGTTTYQSSGGDVLDSSIVTAVLSGNGSAHNCEPIRDSFSGAGGESGGAGASGSYDGGTSSS
jgi:uncharacterized membrane protein YgcG